MNGIIIIDKEKGWTSNDIVQKLKNCLHEKIGHTGTLDPLATGVLPILVGKGTLLSKYIINHDKEYIATIKLGEKTSTGDSEGKIIEQKEINPNFLKIENIKKVLNLFIGKQKQIPPMYSAIKVNGKKLYEYARKGQTIEVKPREIEIFKIELISFDDKKNEIQYKVKCSKGTYIRSLSENIAENLGTVGFMKELRRTQVGDFKIEKSIKISDIIKDSHKIEENFIDLEHFFENKAKIKLNQKQLTMFLNGVKIHQILEDDLYKVYDKNEVFIGLGVVTKNKLKREICIN